VTAKSHHISPTVLALFTIAAVSYLWIDGKRAAALFVALSVTGGVVLVTVLKFGFARPRPELVSHLINVNSFSFPSGHAGIIERGDSSAE
jgi:undecaprenyl-diphosphatase